MPRKRNVERYEDGSLMPLEAIVAQRSYAKIMREANKPKTLLDGLADLPWTKMPSTAESADEVARILGNALRGLDSKSEAFEVMLSFRDYFHAFGARQRKHTAMAGKK